MASLKDLKNRIASVKATQKITKAMQLVAAAKLRRAQDAAEASRPYAERMAHVLANLAASTVNDPDAPLLLTGRGEDKVHLLVVCTADRGLCGGFNTSIVRKAVQDALKLQAEGKTVRFLCVGRKGYDVLRRAYRDQIIGLIEFRNVRRIGYPQAQEVGEKIVGLFETADFDVATLYYAEFKSVISQKPTALQLIPAAPAATVEGTEEDDKAPDDAATGPAVYEYEPEPAEILDVLVPKNITVQIFRALLENAASEQGARMTAMDNATRNAGEMIDKLSMQYNRTRQAQITKELIEIISGAEAL
ncbi:F0F1 ATP synthase subunit gamma [Acuticoccus sp. MNP-M23]|uniref:F0F1 ATP synthase subunit gamma n=1 Tax=Acuticoccus sp. MNP-M23 TaxID=3072793 RepID=UPI002815F952|nr:F0F1 ATP synthase subunit gamma [Acuticoccus sp. MNP-M23]WMS43294.1 F0F1 ATP synthase subunit gamma [Acuticoccus sp. MNP-M23]